MDLNALTIHEAHAGLKNKKFSSAELAQACFSRIEQLNGKLNAFVALCKEKALVDAEKADKLIEKTKDFSPLCGIPCALKDIFCTEGVSSTACSKILKGFTPSYDAASVKRLKDAGMVMLGKTNTDEFACGASTETSCYGSTKNPWDLERVPGGSSGGSGAAVSADMCIYATGTDTGGSIRQPAAFCGVAGLKPTYGRVSRFGVIAMTSSLDSVGAFAKDVFDIALILNVMAGRDELDSTTPDREVPDYTENLNAGDLSGLTVGLPEEYFIPGMEKDVGEKVNGAVETLAKLGAKIKKISLPHTKYGVAVYYIICPSELSANLARFDGIRYGPAAEYASDLFDFYLRARDQGFGDEIKRRIMIGTYSLSAGYYDAYYLKAQKVRTLIKQDFDKAFEEVDAICAPVSPTAAFKIGENISDPIKMYLCDIFTIPVNLAGVCSLALPCGFSKNNLPIGMQIIGPQFGEPRILKIGHAYQQNTDWHTKKPRCQ